jgi:hypothetical protein
MSYANSFVLYASCLCIQFGWKFIGKLLFENLQKRECNTAMDSTGNMLKQWEPEEIG